MSDPTASIPLPERSLKEDVNVTEYIHSFFKIEGDSGVDSTLFLNDEALFQDTLNFEKGAIKGGEGKGTSPFEIHLSPPQESFISSNLSSAKETTHQKIGQVFPPLGEQGTALFSYLASHLSLLEGSLAGGEVAPDSLLNQLNQVAETHGIGSEFFYQALLQNEKYLSYLFNPLKPLPSPLGEAMGHVRSLSHQVAITSMSQTGVEDKLSHEQEKAFTLEDLIKELPPELGKLARSYLSGQGTDTSLHDLLASFQPFLSLINGANSSNFIPPISQIESANRSVAVTEKTIVFAKSLTDAADTLTKEGHAQFAAVQAFLAAIALVTMQYRQMLYDVLNVDSRLQNKMNHAAMLNTVSQMDAAYEKMVEERRKAQEEAERRARLMRGLGGFLIGLSILAGIILAVVTFGAGTPVSAGVVAAVVSGAVGGIIGGANMIAQGYGAPNLGSVIADAMQKSMSDQAMEGVAISMMVIAVILSVVSFGSMSFVTSFAGGLGAGVGASLGTIGMTAMTEAFTRSLTEALARDYKKAHPNASEEEIREYAQKWSSAINWIFTGLVMASSLVSIGASLFKTIQAARVASTAITNVAPTATGQAVSSGASAGGGQAAGGVAGAAAAGTTSVTAAGLSGVGAAVGGGTTTVAASGAAATRAISEALKAASNALKSIVKTAIVPNFNYIQTAINVSSDVVQALSSYSQAKLLQAQANLVEAQAAYEETAILTQAATQMVQSVVSSLVTSSQKMVKSISDVSSLFTQIMNNMVQSMTAISSKTQTKMASPVSGAITQPKEEKEISSSSSPPDKETIESISAMMPGMSPAAVMVLSSAVSQAVSKGLNSKLFSTSLESAQVLGLTNLLSVMTQKIASLMEGVGIPPELAQKLASQLGVAILKGLAVKLKSGSISDQGTVEEQIEDSASLEVLKELGELGVEKQDSSEVKNLPFGSANFSNLSGGQSEIQNLMQQIQAFAGPNQSNSTEFAYQVLLAMRSILGLKSKGGSLKDDEDPIGELLNELSKASETGESSFFSYLSDGNEPLSQIGATIEGFLKDTEEGTASYALFNPA